MPPAPSCHLHQSLPSSILTHASDRVRLRILTLLLLSLTELCETCDWLSLAWVLGGSDRGGNGCRLTGSRSFDTYGDVGIVHIEKPVQTELTRAVSDRTSTVGSAAHPVHPGSDLVGKLGVRRYLELDRTRALIFAFVAKFIS